MIFCSKCGNEIKINPYYDENAKESIKIYPFDCSYCDENMFYFETEELKEVKE